MLEKENKGVKVMIAGDREGLAAAEKYSLIYKKLFDVIYENSINEFEGAYEAAKERAMTHMLYFVNDIDLLLVSFADELGGYTLEITVDDLEKVLSQNAQDKL